MDDKILILTEFIRQSPNREKVLKTIDEEVLKPSEITNRTNIHINNVSRSLRQLREKNLVYLLNPEAKRNRLYRLTEDGKEVLKYME